MLIAYLFIVVADWLFSLISFRCRLFFLRFFVGCRSVFFFVLYEWNQIGLCALLLVFIRCMRLSLLSSSSSSCKKFCVFHAMEFFVYVPNSAFEERVRDSIHKTPYKLSFDQIVYSSVKSKPKTCQPMEKSFFSLSFSSFLLFISLRLSSLVWHFISLFFVCFFVLNSPVQSAFQCSVHCVYIVTATQREMQWMCLSCSWRWHDKINESMKQKTSINYFTLPLVIDIFTDAHLKGVCICVPLHSFPILFSF